MCLVGDILTWLVCLICLFLVLVLVHMLDLIQHARSLGFSFAWSNVLCGMPHVNSDSLPRQMDCWICESVAVWRPSFRIRPRGIGCGQSRTKPLVSVSCVMWGFAGSGVGAKHARVLVGWTITGFIKWSSCSVDPPTSKSTQLWISCAASSSHYLPHPTFYTIHS